MINQGVYSKIIYKISQKIKIKKLKRIYETKKEFKNAKMKINLLYNLEGG
jgi:hypothetical protein